MIPQLERQRIFAWRPMWVHQEYPPWGLGRMRWLRWVDGPVEDLQARLDRARCDARISAVVGIAAFVVLVWMVLSGFRV